MPTDTKDSISTTSAPPKYYPPVVRTAPGANRRSALPGNIYTGMTVIFYYKQLLLGYFTGKKQYASVYFLVIQSIV